MSALSGLYPSFLGSSTVLNDGKSPNILTVALTNSNMFEGTSEQVDIEINSALDLAFYFIADAGKGIAHKPHDKEHFILNWALASANRIEAIQPHLYLPGEQIDYKHLKKSTPGWTFTPDKPNIHLGKLSTLHGWKIKPAKALVLKPGESLLLVFSNIITDLPDGPSITYVAYQAPGKSDFIRCGPLHKTPNIVWGDKVGIGTTDPQYPLSIQTSEHGPKVSIWDGKGDHDSYNGFATSNNQFNYLVNTETSDHVFYAGGKGTTKDLGSELLRIGGNGKVSVPNNLTVKDLNVKDLKVTDTVAIGGKALFPLAIQSDQNGPKISLWDGGTSGTFNGFSISDKQMNYQVHQSDNDHVFYEGGDGTISNLGTELMRIQGDGQVSIRKKLTVTDLNVNDKVAIGGKALFPLAIQSDQNGPKISLWDGGTSGAFNGFSISSKQMNYQVYKNDNDHVFYAGGDGTIQSLGNELFRVTGKGKLKGGSDKDPLMMHYRFTRKDIEYFKLDGYFWVFGTNAPTEKYFIMLGPTFFILGDNLFPIAPRIGKDDSGCWYINLGELGDPDDKSWDIYGTAMGFYNGLF